MAIDKQVSDYVDNKVDDKLEAFGKAQEAKYKALIETTVKTATTEGLHDITGRVEKVEKRVEMNERAIRQSEFVVFTKRGQNLGVAMIKERLETVFGKTSIARVQALNNTTFRVVPSVVGKSYDMVQHIGALNKIPATSLPFFADVSRTKQQQADRREKRKQFDEKRAHATVNNYSLAQLEKIVNDRKRQEAAMEQQKKA